VYIHPPSPIACIASTMLWHISANSIAPSPAVLVEFENRKSLGAVDQPHPHEAIEIAAHPAVLRIERGKSHPEVHGHQVHHLLRQIDHRNEERRARLVRIP